jgi:hypothetical protein
VSRKFVEQLALKNVNANDGTSKKKKNRVVEFDLEHVA